MNEMILECPKCKLRWKETPELPMTMDAFLARLKAFGVCPDCGNKKDVVLLTGKDFKEAYDEMEKQGTSRLKVKNV
jgi:predicted nucleic-acid-binding Zn-ribbon protein